MQEQLKDYIEKIPSGFAFNLRYRPENLRKFDVLKPVDRKEPNVKTSYYTSLYNLKTIFKLEDHFVFQPGFRTEETDIDVKNGSSRRSHISKRHPVIQKALYDYLVKEYGKENVGTENLTPIGTEIDIVAKHGDEYDLYEIKTISDIRLCIRESLSQLLEYGLYHTDIKVRNYYIVGSIVSQGRDTDTPHGFSRPEGHQPSQTVHVPQQPGGIYKKDNPHNQGTESHNDCGTHQLQQDSGSIRQHHLHTREAHAADRESIRSEETRHGLRVSRQQRRNRVCRKP